MHGTRFYRPARDLTYSYNRLPRDEITILTPPVMQPSQGGAGTWIQILLPLVGSLGSFVFIVAYHPPLLILCAAVGVALLTVVMGIAMRFQQRYVVKKRERGERTKYLGYLEKVRTELKETAQLQLQVNLHLHPFPGKLVEVVTQLHQQQPQLWERRLDDTDFLHVRIGVGTTPLCRPLRLEVANNPLIEYVPELRSEGETLVAAYSRLEHAPIAIDLRSIGTLAITGSSQLTRTLTRSMLSQVAAFHSPGDVRFAVYFPSTADQEWNWLKWLPHTRRLHQVKGEKQYAPESLCLLADSVADFQETLSKQIAPELGRRHQLLEDKKDAAALMKPHLIIVLDSFSPESELAQLADVQKLFLAPENGGIDPAQHCITVICLVNSIRQEPSSVKARLTLADLGQLSFQKIMESSGRLEDITADALDLPTCEKIARSLAPLSLAEHGSQHDLSQDVHLLGLLNITSAETIQTSASWKPRSKQQFLHVPIGVKVDGLPLMLDLKEAADKGMGPHGLVVGATGLGKSELLRTLIISLAITHDPDAVNFLLVDFKGGASFADFETLPHVAGIVTNLKSDLLLVNRIYESLQGEVERRQAMLREAGNLAKIQEYQELWRTHPNMEPMPI